MQITDEQADIISAFSRGESLVADARAGAGKTSTTRMCAESRRELRGVFLAFNRAIAGDAKASFPPSVSCSTVHSVAFREVGHEYQHRLNGPRVTGRQTAEILGWSRWMRFGIASWSPSKVVRVAMDTVTRFCHSADLEIGKQHVPWIDGIEDGPGDLGQREEFVACIVPLARKAWIDLQDIDGRLRFSHDAYLKLYSLSDPTIPCDYLCFDEAQDSSPVIAHIIQCQDHAQKMITGDPLQQIYEWRGSVDAMSDFDVDARLPLSQSFRFGEAIANEANHWLELLDADPLVRGSDWIESTVGPVEAPKAILCRTNAQVVSEVIEQQKKGFQPAIVGGAAPIISFAEAAIELKAGKGTWHHDLQGFKDWEQVKTYCLAPGTRLLADDLHWVPIEDLEVGDQLVGFDEEVKIGEKGRRFHTTDVEATCVLIRPCYVLRLNDGRTITSSFEHRWMTRGRGKNKNMRWKRTENLKPGDQIVSIGTWEMEDSRSAGWLAGIFDGEGCLSGNSSNHHTRNLGFTQRCGPIADRAIALLSERGFELGVSKRPDGVWQVTIHGGLSEKLRLLGSIRPERLVAKAENLWENRQIGWTSHVVVESIEFLGDQEVVALSTGTGTFVAEGMLSHNCEQDHGGRDLRTLVRVVDEYGPQMVIAMMNNCQPETVAPVVISTAHKAKGREWSSVRLANDFHVQPHEDKKTGEMKDPPESELRLAYVAVTRAKHELDACGLYASEAA